MWERRGLQPLAVPQSGLSLYYLLLSFKIKQAQDEERRQLVQLRDILKSALQVEQKEVRGFDFEGWLFVSSVSEALGLRQAKSQVLGAHSSFWGSVGQR